MLAASIQRPYQFFLARAVFCVLVLVFYAGASTESFSREDWSILGLKLGMTPAQVRDVLSSTENVSRHQERMRKQPEASSDVRIPRVIYAWFNDDRALQVEFSNESSPISSSISLTYQGKSFDSSVLPKIIEKYGNPHSRLSASAGSIMAWGGKAEKEGAVTPFPGSAAFLRAEQINRKLVTLTLTSNKQ